MPVEPEALEQAYELGLGGATGSADHATGIRLGSELDSEVLTSYNYYRCQ